MMMMMNVTNPFLYFPFSIFASITLFVRDSTINLVPLHNFGVCECLEKIIGAHFFKFNSCGGNLYISNKLKNSTGKSTALFMSVAL